MVDPVGISDNDVQKLSCDFIMIDQIENTTQKFWGWLLSRCDVGVIALTNEIKYETWKGIGRWPNP